MEGKRYEVKEEKVQVVNKKVVAYNMRKKKSLTVRQRLVGLLYIMMGQVRNR